MNARDLRPIFNALLPSLSGFVGHKHLLLMTPMNGLLRAVDFDSSGFDKAAFRPRAIVVPLCVPSDHLSLLFGRDVRHPTEGEWWTAKLPNLVPDLQTAIHEQALPFLAQADTLLGFVELAKPFWQNPHTPKEIAFALARAGHRDQAIATIDAFVPKLKPKVGWEQKIVDDSIALRDMLISDPDEAQRTLESWERYTLEKLRLEQFQ